MSATRNLASEFYARLVKLCEPASALFLGSMGVLAEDRPAMQAA